MRFPRASLVAACLTAACWFPSVPRAENYDERVDGASGWKTQEWSERGQNNLGTGVITTPFINGPNPGSLLGNPNAWEYRAPGAFVGPIATDYVAAARSLFGPQGVGFGFLESDPIVGITSMSGNGSDFNYLTGCGPFIGTPVVFALPDVVRAGRQTVGYAFVMGLSSNCPDLRRSLVEFVYTSPVGVGGPSSAGGEVGFGYSSSLGRNGYVGQAHAHFNYEPVRDGVMLYYASSNRSPFQGPYGPAALYATDWSTMKDLWVVPLQTGSGLTTPTPIGQPPPPPAESFHAITGVAVNRDLLVVGAVKYDSEDFLTTGYALMAYNTRDGTQRWVYRTDTQIMDRPVITDQYVFFATIDGRVYSIEHSNVDPAKDGKLHWVTPYAARIQYATYPHGAGQATANVKLYGPALDGTGQYLYFGGSDGRVHRFSAQGGEHASSNTLLEFAEGGVSGGCNIYFWYDNNGVKQIRPCPINSPPAVFNNKFLVVKCYTQRTGTTENGAFLCIVKIPDLTFNPQVTAFNTGLRVRRNDAVFQLGQNEFGIVQLNSNFCNLLQYDPVLQTSYVARTGNGFLINTNPFSFVDDTGGVSITNGFVTATDSAGHLIAIPSREGASNVGGGVSSSPPTGPPEYNPPVVLGPIQVYPNPYNPATAVGGTLKFNNLPAGSYVELYTLGYERVRTVHEIGYTARWDGKNEAGQIVAPGTYLYKVWLPDSKPPVTGRVVLTRN